MTNFFFYYFLLAVFYLLFFIIAYKNFRTAIGLFIIFLPAYLLRLNILNIPTTVLELCFFILLVVWLVKYGREDWLRIKIFILQYRTLFILIGLFLLFSFSSIFVTGEYFKAIGIWRAYFFEPVIFFFILLGRSKQIRLPDLLLFLALSTVSISIFAIIQRFTGFGIATAEWTEVATRRATSFFSSPNAVGLYLVPVTLLLIEPIIKKHKLKVLYIFVVILNLLALLFTKSEGALVALLAGLVVLIFFSNYRKIAVGLVVFGLLMAVLVPSINSALLFKDRASHNRILLWSYSWNYLTQKPSNFILGTGFRQFYNKVQKPVHNWQVIERHIYPHNILLNFWTEIGLLGAVTFVILFGYLLLLASKVWKYNILSGAVLIAMLMAVFVHGLVDVPYFKNDLALLFWIIIAYVLLSLQFVNNAGRGNS